MDASFLLISLLNGLSVGLLLFMLASGLTLIFSMMGVLNFAHASFYMLGAYVAYSITQVIGFWSALLLAPLVVGLLGALFERHALRRVHKFGHVPELLITFGLQLHHAGAGAAGLGPAGGGLHAACVAERPAVHDRRCAVGLSFVWGDKPPVLRRSAARCAPPSRPSAPSAWAWRC